MVINPEINEIKITPIMGFDLETTGLFPWMGAEIDLIALHNGDTGYILEVKKYSKEDLTEVFTRLQDVLLIGHNIKFDCNFVLHYYGIQYRKVHCTMVAAQIIDNGRQKDLRFGLIDVLRRFLGPAYAISKEEKEQLQLSFTNPIIRAELERLPSIRKRQIEYAAEDVEHLIELMSVQMEQIQKLNLEKILKLEMAVLPILSQMEVTGVLIDRKGWTELIKEWEKELLELELTIDEESLRLLDGRRTKFKFGPKYRGQTLSVTDLFGSTTTNSLSSDHCINYASSDQLLQIWREFGETPPEDGEGSAGVGEEALETYLTERPDTRLQAFIDLILKHRQLSKLLSTYGYSFLEQLDKNDRIHTSYTQTRTETGRLSSRQPNLQNIPANKEKNRDVRRFFITSKGNKLITCDMSGAEVSIAADYSKEPLLLNSLLEGTDMHSELASVSFSIIFGKPITISKSSETIEIDDEIYTLSELRDIHKSVTFAKFYKAGAKRIYQTLAKYINRHHKPEQRMVVAGRVSTALDERMPELSRYLSDLITEAQTTGKLVSDKLGRIRYFTPTVYGEAANFPIQGTNANALKIALVRLDKYLKYFGKGILLMNIHDEVVVEVPEEDAEEVAKEVQTIMGGSLSYFFTTLKGGATASIGDFWKK